jgi:hypothetical protein
MKECGHALNRRAYGWVLMGFIHREVELCEQCQHFRLLDDPLQGWLLLKDKSMFEDQELPTNRLLLAGPAPRTGFSLRLRPEPFGLQQSAPDPEQWTSLTRISELKRPCQIVL